MDITHVIWDWNGTLFDDLACSLDVANRLLTEFGLPTLDGVDAYHAKFRFPIIDYYAELGFDVSPTGNFEAAAHRYIELYSDASRSCSLQQGAVDTLASLNAAGLRQVLISASRQQNLDAQRAPFALDRWLSGAFGNPDIYAHSKEWLVRRWLSEEGVEPRRVLTVGDCEHDVEIADTVGTRCVLFSGGHHSRHQLNRHGVPIVEALSEVPGLLGALSG